MLRFIPSGLARLHGALPIEMSGNALRVALVDPFDQHAAEDLRFALGKDIHVVVSPPEQIENLIRQYYGTDTSSMEEVLKQLGEAGELLQLREGDGAAAVEAEANATPIIRFVDLILYQAIQDRASDIHFEPFENEFKIRYRVDGALYEMAPPPRHLALPVISRVKVMANMNIAERRLPQDGRIQKNIAGRSVDLRVSTLPTQFGESLVLRVLDRSVVNLDLEALGMPDYIYNFLVEMIQRPNGIFIATGPTGSGKTTTLYSCLRKINTIDSKLLTAEEPVEYDLEGIVQVPVNEAIGLTFARVLRSFLRQDPDRIMIGETRDLETAQIAIQASLTGHLVFTTLHTNDAPGAITRMGLSYDAVRRINPRITMCSISAFGQTGPLSAEPGYDFIAQAYAGVTHMIGDPEGPPAIPMLGLGDVTTGAHAVAAIVAALLHRERTGEGQYLDVSILDAYFHCHELNVQIYSNSKGAVKPKRSGTQSRTGNG